jgi:hypothetical protein
MKKLIILYIAIVSTHILNAQTFNQTYLSDSVQIKELSNKQGDNYKIINYDSDNYWSKIANNIIVNFDDTLKINNVIETPFARDYKIKYGNKLFLLDYAYHYDFDEDFNQIIVKDSISLIFLDVHTREERSIRIADSLIEFVNEYLFLKDSKEFVAISSPRIDVFDTSSIDSAIYFKIVVLDTLGNVLRYNKINRKSHERSIDRQGTNILISNYMYDDNEPYCRKLYYLDINSLELIDSIIIPRNHLYLKTINDSILFGVGGRLNCISVDIYNTINKTFVNNSYNVSSPSVDRDNSYFSNLMIDFVNEDSIFFVCQLRDNSPSDYNSYGIEFFNFKLDGSVNYMYSFNGYQANNKRKIHGITALADGGLIVDIYSEVDYDISNAWLLRYSHNGNLGFTNIETGEKETIKVYPNPAKDYVYVDIKATNFEKGEVELFDIQGKLVKRVKLNAKQGNRVDVSNLNAGAYTYNVSLNGKTISGKIVVRK